MPAQTIAILGATGQTGRGVVRSLLNKPDVRLNIYVRSAAKLKTLIPSIESEEAATIFEGPIHNIDLLTRCVTGVDKIVFTLGFNDNRPDVHVIEQGAASVIAALDSLKAQDPARQPTKVLLLGSTTWNPKFDHTRSPIVDWIVKNAFYYPYLDLNKGTALFLESSSLVKLTLVQPGAIMDDKPNGYELTTDSFRATCTYGDLAEGFVALATSSQYEDEDAVVVSSRLGDANVPKYLPIIFYRVVRGLSAKYVPGFWYIYDLVF